MKLYKWIVFLLSGLTGVYFLALHFYGAPVVIPDKQVPQSLIAAEFGFTRLRFGNFELAAPKDAKILHTSDSPDEPTAHLILPDNGHIIIFSLPLGKSLLPIGCMAGLKTSWETHRYLLTSRYNLFFSIIRRLSRSKLNTEIYEIEAPHWKGFVEVLKKPQGDKTAEIRTYSIYDQEKDRALDVTWSFNSSAPNSLTSATVDSLMAASSFVE